MSDKREKDIEELDRSGAQYSNGKRQGLSELEIEAVDGLKTVEIGFSADQVIAELDPKEQKRILRKVDYRLIPLLALLYLYVPWHMICGRRPFTNCVAYWPSSIGVISEMQRLLVSMMTSSYTV